MNIDKDQRYYSNDPRDLCPECMDKLYAWFEKGYKKIMNLEEIIQLFATAILKSCDLSKLTDEECHTLDDIAASLNIERNEE